MKETLGSLDETIMKFIRSALPSTIRLYIYNKLLFESVVHRHDELRDLVYRPRRWEMPPSRIVRKNIELKNEIENLTNEILDRIHNFKGTD